MPEAPLRREFLGMVEVDSGTLLIGDPTYLLPRATEHKGGVDYQAVIESDTSMPATRLADQPVLLLSRFGGDGSFPVYGEIDEYEELVRVWVEFEGPNDEQMPTGAPVEGHP